MQEENQNRPDVDRLSVIISTVLLSYAVVPFIEVTQQFFGFRLGRFEFTFPLRTTNIIAILAAALAALGTNWLIQNHPKLQKENSWQYLIIPALTAWVIGIPLASLNFGLEWWAVFLFGGLLLLLVMIAEYMVVDLGDVNHMIAAIGLIGVSYALYLVEAIVVRASQSRLFLQIPVLVITLFVISLRAIYLRLGGRWHITWSAGIALFVGQMAVGLHYLPLNPLTFGLILVGPAYALTSFAVSLEENRSFRSSLIEPLVMLGILWGLALVFS